MSNARIAALISVRLRSGLVYPGDPARGVPSCQIALPFGSTAGMPEEMVRLVHTATEQIGEAIVHLIETDGGCELIPRDEAAVMRQAVSDAVPGPEVAVHCRCDKGLKDPLMMLSLSGDRIIVDGGVLIRELSKLSAKCPHERVVTCDGSF